MTYEFYFLNNSDKNEQIFYYFLEKGILKKFDTRISHLFTTLEKISPNYRIKCIKCRTHSREFREFLGK